MIIHYNLKMSEKVIAREVFIEGSDKTKCLCELCNITFLKRTYLNAHLRKFHQLQIMVQRNISCPLCNEKFQTMVLLHEHLQNQHSITLNFVNETFYVEEDFMEWKNKLEKESLSRFIFRNRKIGNGIILSYYSCHRSGPQRIKQTRNLRMRTSGSIKTGSTCPAFIKVSTETVDGISEIKVQYQSVHLGHDLETRSLRLTKEERQSLAACLKLGVPIDKILEEAKRNSSSTNRFCHLTRKHLHNIRRDYGIRLYNEKPQRTSALQNPNVGESDSSNVTEDYVEIEVSNHSELQEHEKSAAVSSLLLLRNHIYSEESNVRKMQSVKQIKELLSKIERWDPRCPFPDLADQVNAINALLDFSSSNRVLTMNEITPILKPSPQNKPSVKRRKVAKNSRNIKELN